MKPGAPDATCEFEERPDHALRSLTWLPARAHQLHILMITINDKESLAMWPEPTASCLTSSAYPTVCNARNQEEKSCRCHAPLSPLRCPASSRP